MQTHIIHTDDACPPATHPSWPRVYVNKKHLRQQGSLPELSSHRGPIFRAQFYFLWTLPLPVADVANWCLIWLARPLKENKNKNKSQPTFKNWEMNITSGFGTTLENSDVHPFRSSLPRHGARWQLPSAGGAGNFSFEFSILLRTPRCLLTLRSLCPLPFVTGLALLLF